MDSFWTGAGSGHISMPWTHFPSICTVMCTGSCRF